MVLHRHVHVYSSTNAALNTTHTAQLYLLVYMNVQVYFIPVLSVALCIHIVYIKLVSFPVTLFQIRMNI